MNDKAWLARMYPGVALAARFLDALRGRTLSDEPETHSLLPANASAKAPVRKRSRRMIASRFLSA